jgi:hypothetical protein
MSRMEARMNVYDVMDRIQVVVRLREQEDVLDVAREWETVLAFTFQGTGETDRREWLQDALIAALESL